MSGGGRRRGRRGQQGGHENHERWLLTYADMLTLLVALFIVMFAVSMVDQRKFEEVAKSLQEAFAGKSLPGGGSIKPDRSGASGVSSPLQEVAAIQPLSVVQAQDRKQRPSEERARAARREQLELEGLKRRVDARLAAHGLQGRVETSVERRGLVMRILTDDVLFASGSDDLRPEGVEILDEIAGVLRLDARHPIAVDGHTDAVPISTSRFPSNWELSAARASRVVRRLAGWAIDPRRLSATGYGQERPRAPNATAAGRQQNRRVEISLTRLEGGAAAPVAPVSLTASSSTSATATTP